jgi:hypothetical protein
VNVFLELIFSICSWLSEEFSDGSVGRVEVNETVKKGLFMYLIL